MPLALVFCVIPFHFCEFFKLPTSVFKRGIANCFCKPGLLWFFCVILLVGYWSSRSVRRSSGSSHILHWRCVQSKELEIQHWLLHELGHRTSEIWHPRTLHKGNFKCVLIWTSHNYKPVNFVISGTGVPKKFRLEKRLKNIIIFVQSAIFFEKVLVVMFFQLTRMFIRHRRSENSAFTKQNSPANVW